MIRLAAIDKTKDYFVHDTKGKCFIMKPVVAAGTADKTKSKEYFD